MATIKAYTDLSQSKTLSKILPLESADMLWANDNDVIVVPYDMATRENVLHDFIPCWSLAALLSIIRKTIGYTLYGFNNVYMSCELGDRPWELETEVYDNEVDACYELILKLHEHIIL